MFQVPNLSDCLRDLLDRIPSGRVTTYGDLAEALGSLSAARWVAQFLRDHPHGADCPCHRVVYRTGEIGPYVSGDPSEKARRLCRDGVAVGDARVDLERYRVRPAVANPPLERLARLQSEIPPRVVQRPWPELPGLAAGADVSYAAGDTAVAAWALWDVAGGGLVWSTVLRRRVEFPYIPGFLSFRELPLLLALTEAARAWPQPPDVVLVDGTGILHPRRAGIAAHFGVAADLPTIGVSKKLLCGQTDVASVHPGRPAPVRLDGETLGMALRSRAASRPVFVSPGQFVDVDSAARITAALFHGHRLPEPLFLADKLSRETARQG